MRYDIRGLQTYGEFQACERLQVDVLGYADLEVIPYQLLHSFATSGGIVCGAFNGETLIGCVIGYTGLLDDGTPYHRSQRLAVLPAYRGQGVGEALKHAQADVARRYGLHLMCWTFDPLRSLNAHFNIHKLGCVSHRYIESAYEVSSSPRDAGLRIDRLWAEWRLDDRRRQVASRDLMPAFNSQQIQIALANKSNAPAQPNLDATAPFVFVQVPQDVDVLRANDLGLARIWRDTTRDVLSFYFAHGYQITDYLLTYGYVLTRDNG